jgi:hypothetical protein
MPSTQDNPPAPMLMEEGEIPQPSPLTRANTEMVEVDPAMVTRYLQYECGYRNCKYQSPRVTWGELIAQDYPHFVQLMSNDIPTDSNTFVALFTQVRPEDQLQVRSATKDRDTPEGKEQIINEFLNLTCTHRGRMNGKTWRDVRDKDYSYFTWAVGNTMNRETKTFKTFRECLQQKERQLVNSMPKGDVKVPKGLKWLAGAAA